jgi:phospholipid/cholesterol/gamma-HCH transport system ATP-binding protein
MANMIKIQNVSKKFGKNVVLHDINLEVEAGSSFVLIGKSGSGKSVLLKNIIGILQPDHGRIQIDGVDTTHIPQYKRITMNNKIGMLFQFSALFDSLNVKDNVVFGINVHKKLNPKQAYDIAIENLFLVGLDESILNKYPSELSGGMQKRVGIARMLATKPNILFFDEPTSGLDPIMSEMINDLIIKTTKYLGATSFTITHDMKSAKKIADKLAMIHNGEIIWQGKPQDVDSSENKILHDFIDGIY